MKRKHPNYRQRKNKLKVPKRFTYPPHWNDDDILSNLPDDCLYQIHRYVDRYSLEILARTSQRMNYIACQSLLRKGKRILQRLQIIRNSTGHVVVATASVNDNFIYYIDQINHQYFAQRVTTDAAGLKTLDSDPTSNFMIEETIRANVKGLTKNNEFQELRFDCITLDLNLLRSCNISGKVKKLFFHGEYRISQQHLFFRWIINSGAEDFSFTATNNDIVPKFNEKFLANFARRRKYLSLEINQQSGFYLNSMRSIEFMNSFKYLKHHKLVLTESQCLQVINRRLSMPNASGSWEFTIDHSNNPLFFFQLDNTFMARQDSFPGLFTCGRSDNFNSIKIIINPPSVSFSRGRFLSLVIVTFFNNNSWLTIGHSISEFER